MATVLIPTALRKFTAEQAEIEVAGTTAGEVLQALAAAHPALGAQILDNGKIRGFVNVFVGDEDIRFLDGEASPVKADDEVTLIPAIAGGF
ncbi:MAG: MoaD/ThiS family protein [Fibrobacteria bacterium]|nr:MoaD/ThiS family protein [Fibrobacteria bacterium]